MGKTTNYVASQEKMKIRNDGHVEVPEIQKGLLAEKQIIFCQTVQSLATSND